MDPNDLRELPASGSALTGNTNKKMKRGMSIVRTNITPLLKCSIEDGIEGIADGLD